MKKLSTGHDSILGNYRKLTEAVFGPDSPATHYIVEKIEQSPKGELEEVLADETQMIYLLTNIHKGKRAD